MPKNDTLAMALALARLKEADILLGGIDAGVCLIHLEACIVSLESHLRKVGLEPDRPGVASTLVAAPSGQGDGEPGH